MGKPLRRIWGILSFVAAAAVHADPVPKIEPMLREDLRPGCGCAFYAQRNRQYVPNEGPLLHWSLAERGWGRSKLDGEIRRLKLLQEKHFPEDRERPQRGDRLVLVFQEDRYHVQAIGSVTQACAPRAATCGTTTYAARLIFRRAGEAPREVDGVGECGC